MVHLISVPWSVDFLKGFTVYEYVCLYMKSSFPSMIYEHSIAIATSILGLAFNVLKKSSLYVYVFICMYVHVYIYTYIYMHTYIYMYDARDNPMPRDDGGRNLTLEARRSPLYD